MNYYDKMLDIIDKINTKIYDYINSNDSKKLTDIQLAEIQNDIKKLTTINEKNQVSNEFDRTDNRISDLYYQLILLIAFLKDPEDFDKSTNEDDIIKLINKISSIETNINKEIQKINEHALTPKPLKLDLDTVMNIRN